MEYKFVMRKRPPCAMEQEVMRFDSIEQEVMRFDLTLDAELND